MPLYEYRCSKCGRRFEFIQKFSDSPRTKCPECKGRLEKLPSAPAIHFKGTGWYVTDYGGKKNGSRDESASNREKAATGPEGTSSSGGEGKPASDRPDKPAPAREDKPRPKPGKK